MTQAIVEELVVKSRHRVKTYGEVFTPRHMVNRMLDLVRDELESGSDFVDKTFLEPAAGDGNFLVAILHRKLGAIEKRYSAKAWAEESLFALASIYGIELLEDNHRDAKDAMLKEFVRFHTRHGVPCGPTTELQRAAAFLIDVNVVRGDALTGLTWRGEEIKFSWWNRIAGAAGLVQREPFRFAALREDSMLDFTAFDTYAVCRIGQVHEQARLGG
ncbi:SAM-dependent DNA methyltransferase [Mycolicibacterium pulveris]|uniref:SAM-dependent DNA methyltransferase n=1 Tax=Mycolicibacterium pulveris TaxID=36813 RepID=UPI003CEDEDF6